MPIKDPTLYPDNWREISNRIRFERAGGRCEWCDAPHNMNIGREREHPENWRLWSKIWYRSNYRKIRVILTVAHLDHDPGNNTDGNLAALCQRCHLRYDAAHHAQNAARTRRARMEIAGQMKLIEVGND
jgi:hypothetical protein